MADFTKWVVAAEKSIGWPQGAFLDSYAANRAQADQAAVENNPVALAIVSLMDGRSHWSGAATELRQTLRDRFPNITEDSQSFPRSDARLGAALRPVLPALRRRGVSVAFNRAGKAGFRVIKVGAP